MASRGTRPAASTGGASTVGRSQTTSASHSSVTQSASRSHRRGKAGARRGQPGMEGGKSAESLIKVLDPDTKEDRTPLSLLRTLNKPTRGNAQGKKGVNESNASGSQFSEADMDQSYSRVGESSDSGSTMDKSISMSVAEADETGEPSAMMDGGESTETSSISSTQIADLDAGPSRKEAKAEEDDHGSVLDKRRKEMTAEEKRAWMAGPCVITLTETATFFIIDKADGQIAIDSEQAKKVAARNDAYAKMLKEKEPTRYAERSAQTLNNPHKNKETQFARYEQAKAGVGVTSWDIYDTMRRLEDDDDDSEPGDVAIEKTGEEGEEVGDIDDDANAILDAMGGDDGDGGDGAEGRAKQKRNTWMLTAGLPHALMIVERMVVQNVWQAEQLQYRNVHLDTGVATQSPADLIANEDARADRAPGSPARSEHGDDEAEDQSALQVLWRYSSPIVKDQNVSCFGWNRHNPDILAAGYGDNAASATSRGGYVCCWSLKNPVVPERTFKIDLAGVSSVDFSSNHPSLLAVGHTDGALALFDIRKQGNTPILKSTVSGGQHTGTIWQVKWVLKGKDRGESLVSISADGRVTDWSIKKGLECTNLLRLKRVPNKQPGATAGTDALLARQSGGMCVDFNPTERMMYIVGTEDSTLHKCSTSYNEQYLETYVGHTGPVYRCRWSPFCSDVFLSCSADWTTRLWRQDCTDPLFTFQSVADAVQDVCWSPEASTIFASITTGGRVDVWDVQNPIEPKMWIEMEDRTLNCLAFAEQNPPVLVVGDNMGEITVLKLKGADFESPSPENSAFDVQEERLLKLLRKDTH